MQFLYWFSMEKPNTEGVHRPMPDVSKLPSYHYLDVFDTPLVDNNKL